MTIVGLFFIFCNPLILSLTPDIVKINFPHIFTELKAANFGDIKEISIVINAKNTVNIAIRAHFI